MKWSRPPSGLRQVPARLTGVWLCLSAAHYCLESQCCCPPAAQDQAKDRTGPSLLCGGQVRATLCSRFLKGQSWSPQCCRCQGAWGSSPDSAPPGMLRELGHPWLVTLRGGFATSWAGRRGRGAGGGGGVGSC